MLSTFRNASKSVIGIIIIAFIGLMIIIGFAVGDVQNLGFGGSGLSSSTLAKVGSIEITDREMSDAMQRRMSQVREQNPEADYSALAGDFEPILQALIDQRALEAFAEKNGLSISKRLVDAEIANLPGVKGLDGKVSTEAYQAFLTRQRMTDAEVRQIITGTLLQRLLLAPAASSARMPIGIATPYASMLLEERIGEVVLVPLRPFAERLRPTDQQLQGFYAQNRSRYMVPEQRVLRLAAIGGAQANVAPSEQEIAAYYRANQATYGAKDIRVISQAVVQDANVARQIAERARGGQSFVEAVRPAGLAAADVSVGPQTREQFASLAGEKAAAAAFAAASGSVTGPVQSDLGWHVIKIDRVQRQAGKTLEQARGEIVARLAGEKRQQAIADLVDKAQDLIDGGSNFAEVARQLNLQVTTTPLVTASGTARGNPAYKFPAPMTAALKSGFELAPTDDPVIEQVAEESFVLVAPAQVVAAAPAPFASVREQVEIDWLRQEAGKQARAMADAIAQRSRGTGPMADAIRLANAPSGVRIEAARARRLQLTQMGTNIPAPLRILFSTPQGRTKVGVDPDGRGFFVVRVNKIISGNALNQPTLITEVQKQFSEPQAEEYGIQFLNAIKQAAGVKRNDRAIRETKQRITGGN